MSHQPRPDRQHRSIVISDDDWEPGGAATAAMDANRNQIFEELWRWYMRRPGAELPERPPQHVIDQADATWEERKAEIRRRAMTLECPACKALPGGPCLTSKGRGPKRPTDTIHRPRLIAAVQEIRDEEREARKADQEQDAD